MNRAHESLERIEAAMAGLADCEFGLRRLDVRLYALCAAPLITDEAIDAVQVELGEMRGNLARLRRVLCEMRRLA